jgi:hypothetical protein
VLGPTKRRRLDAPIAVSLEDPVLRDAAGLVWGRKLYFDATKVEATPASRP